MYVSELRETFHAVQVSFEGGLCLGISWKEGASPMMGHRNVHIKFRNFSIPDDKEIKIRIDRYNDVVVKRERIVIANNVWPRTTGSEGGASFSRRCDPVIFERDQTTRYKNEKEIPFAPRPVAKPEI